MTTVSAPTEPTGRKLFGGLTGRNFTLNVLNGMAVGIVITLIPNAALGQFLGWLGQSMPVFTKAQTVGYMLQFLCAPLIGFLVGVNFKFQPLESASLALVAFIAAGNVQLTETGYVVKGIGDMLNVLFATSLGALLTIHIRGVFGSLTLLLHPITLGIGVGTVALLCLPYISQITTQFGNLINSATELQPYIMAPLISMAFCFAVTSPISSVALGLITGVTGLAAGAGNMGVATAATFLIVSAFRLNSIGVPIAIFFGGIKMMLPNLIAKPFLFLPMLALAAVNGLLVPFFNILGTKDTAGFGYISFIGPLKAAELTEGGATTATWISLGIAYFVIPFALALAMHYVMTKVLKRYSNDDFVFGLGKK